MRPSASSTFAWPRNSPTGVGSRVADRTTILRSSRTSRWTRRARARAKSPSRWRSWNSSNTTQPMPSRNGSARTRRRKTPSVIAVTRVFLDTCLSKRTWYPTDSPTDSPRSKAMRRAAARAASLRGSSSTTGPKPALSRATGTRVVLPDPVGARSTRFGLAPRDAQISGRSESTGRVIGVLAMGSRPALASTRASLPEAP